MHRPLPFTAIAVLSSLFLLTAAGTAAADHPQADLRGCASVDDDALRLTCYDRVSGRAPANPDTEAPLAKAAPIPVQPSPDIALTAPSTPDDMSTPPENLGSAPDGSMLSHAWSFEPDSERYLIKLYRPNYLNPVRWQNRTNKVPFEPLATALEADNSQLDKVEAAFQISFKTRIWASNDRRFGAWLAYTQQSFWQIYNSENSSPFRDTNYEPEVKLTWQPQRSWGGFDWNLLSVGYAHQSNGRADPISRSWDRLVAEVGIEKGNFALLLRPWIRIDDDTDDTDNPDIIDYYGHGDLTAVYKRRGHSFTLTGRGNIGEQKGALRLTWMTPKLIGPLRGYVVGFTGYGDTLLDYNFKQTAVSVGFALNDLLDR